MAAFYETKVRNQYLAMDKQCPSIAAFGRNLNLCHLDNKLDPCYHREDTIMAIQKILLRKSKANVLLTGAAGCGKTAIVEAVAAAITESNLQYSQACTKATQAYNRAVKHWEAAGSTGEKPTLNEPVKPPLCDCVVYDLSLNAMVSGTKYRGEFEGRIEQVLQECKKSPDVILFIDELHHLCKVGASEGCISAGQILKPALARNDIRVIGATTTAEKAMVFQDAALARRFCELEVNQLQADAASDTARRILAHYCAYHRIRTDVSADYLLSQVCYHLPNTVFPDNFINVVDETLAGAVFDGLSSVDIGHFNQTLSRMTGSIILCTGEIDVRQAG